MRYIQEWVCEWYGMDMMWWCLVKYAKTFQIIQNRNERIERIERVQLIHFILYVLRQWAGYSIAHICSSSSSSPLSPVDAVAVVAVRCRTWNERTTAIETKCSKTHCGAFMFSHHKCIWILNFSRFNMVSALDGGRGGGGRGGFAVMKLSQEPKIHNLLTARNGYIHSSTHSHSHS